MIPVSDTPVESLIQKDTARSAEPWASQVRDRFTDVNKLLAHLRLSATELPYAVDFNQRFKLKVTRHFVNLMTPGDPFDPLLLQVLPVQAENETVDSFSTDPLLEANYSPVQGLIHKYKNRALLITHEDCAVHCRYCFRRHFPYQEQRLNTKALDQAITYLHENTDIHEIILSGGDPLNLNDAKLTALIDNFDQIDHLKTIRFHTRTPVLAPKRLTKKLITRLASSQKKIVFVLHINHPNELSRELKEEIQNLRKADITILNQSVLLKGVNDCVSSLVELSHALFAAGVLPYYLHQLDKTKGTHHFLITDHKAHTLWLGMQAELSGYLVPRLVREVPNKASKTWINPTDCWTS